LDKPSKYAKQIGAISNKIEGALVDKLRGAEAPQVCLKLLLNFKRDKIA